MAGRPRWAAETLEQVQVAIVWPHTLLISQGCSEGLGSTWDHPFHSAVACTRHTGKRCRQKAWWNKHRGH